MVSRPDSSNTLEPMMVTVSEMVKLFSAVQPEKALELSATSLPRKVTEESCVQSLKVYEAI